MARQGLRVLRLIFGPTHRNLPGQCDFRLRSNCAPFRPDMDCDRSSLLDYEFPLPIFYQGHTTGSTNSTWGQHWTTLHYWTPVQIAETFRQYWHSTFTATDKSQPVTSRAVIDWIVQTLNQEPPATLEPHIRRIFDVGILSAHGIATSSQPPPSDAHSAIRIFENVVFGEPDYLLRSRYTNQVTGICEAKSPWNIGPSEIDDVITSLTQSGWMTADVPDNAGASSAGRLAIEQLYGYMCWNSTQLGILTTTTGFAFLRREDGGILYLSRLYGSHRSLEPFRYELPSSMAPQSTFTISHMLYWFSAMAEPMPPLPETRMAAAIQVQAAYRAVQQLPTITVYATTVPTNYSLPPLPPAPGTGSGPYTLQSTTNVFLEFKPWLRQNHRGGRAWSALLLPEKTPVVVKCWDSYKNNDNAQNAEVSTYLRLQELWGICIPTFIAVGRVGFCHALVIEDLKVISSSMAADNNRPHLCRRITSAHLSKIK